jgi:hypothetical protein
MGFLFSPVYLYLWKFHEGISIDIGHNMSALISHNPHIEVPIERTTQVLAYAIEMISTRVREGKFLVYPGNTYY